MGCQMSENYIISLISLSFFVLCWLLPSDILYPTSNIISEVRYTISDIQYHIRHRIYYIRHHKLVGNIIWELVLKAKHILDCGYTSVLSLHRKVETLVSLAMIDSHRKEINHRDTSQNYLV